MSPSSRGPALFWRVAIGNAAVLAAACVITAIVFAPSGTDVALRELAIFGGSLVTMLALNLLLLRHALGPLRELTSFARRIDPLEPGLRLQVTGGDSEATELADAFNDMLERLEAERRESVGRALAAQEGERLRVAQDLHDQVGQTLTAALLELQHVAGRVPDASRPEVEAVQEIVQLGLEDIRRIARELRPEALDDLGLPSALAALTERFARQARLEIDLHVDHELPRLGREAELVIYRVAQEALTNVARHSGSATAELRLERSGPDRVSLVVSDNGKGLTGEATAGSGMQGMAERASTVEAALSVDNRNGGGTQIRLDVPIEEEGLWYR